MNIPITKVVFNNDDLQAIIKPLESGWVVQGPQVKKFEKRWSEFTKAKNSIAVSNCTTALHLSLAALDIKSGDKVIVPAFTWVSYLNSYITNNCNNALSLYTFLRNELNYIIDTIQNFNHQ